VGSERRAEHRQPSEPWPLVGRERELATVHAALEPGAAGAVVAGSPGSGKTAVAARAVQTARERGRATLWVSATSAARGIPFGAMAALAPGEPRPSMGEAQLLAAMAAELEVRGEGGVRPLVCIDDAHLLDGSSAALVHHLVSTARASALLTTTPWHPTCDALSALWKDGGAAWIELEDLAPGSVEELLCSVLGGPVDGALAHRLRRASGGNPHLLRELIVAARAEGALGRVDDLWRQVAPLPLGDRLERLVGERVDRLPDAPREVVDHIALGQPLELSFLERLCGLDPIVIAEQSGVVEVVSEGRRTVVQGAYPVYAEVLSRRVGALRARRASSRLADSLALTPLRRRGDELRLARWRLGAGETIDSRLALAAAAQAMADGDHDLCLQLADVAWTAGGGFAASAQAAQALMWQGSADRAGEWFGRAAAEAPDRPSRQWVALARAANLFLGQGLTHAADLVLAQGERESDEPVALFAPLRALMSVNRGRIADAVELAGDVGSDSGGVGVLASAAAETAALAWAGRPADALRRSDEVEAVTRELSPPPELSQLVQVGRCTALEVAGRFDEAGRLAREEYRRALDDGDDGRRAAWAFATGRALVREGRVGESIGWLADAVAVIRAEPGRVSPLIVGPCLATLAEAQALAGEVDAAAAALVESASAIERDSYIAQHGLAEAWVAAARGELERGRELAAEVADRAAGLGARVAEARALVDLGRLGGGDDGIAERLERLVAGLQGGLLPTWARASRALADGSADRLESVGSELAHVLPLLAAELLGAASDAYGREHRRAAAAVTATRARLLAEACGVRSTPLLQGLQAAAAELTAREREISALAAHGSTNREIADQLVVSVRTVENHLHRVFAKAGVSSRRDLSVVVTPGQASLAPE